MKRSINLKNIMLLITLIVSSLIVLSFFLIFLFFHYTSHSYWSTNKIWAYTRSDTIPYFHLSRAEFFTFPKPMKDIKRETYGFRVFFPDTKMVFRYSITPYGNPAPSLTRPIMERHANEPLFHLLIEGNNGDRWDYTSPTIYELLSKTTFGLEQWTINLRQKPLEYSPKPGYYSVTLMPNVNFIQEAKKFENIYFMSGMRDESSNKFVHRLIQLNLLNQILPVVVFSFIFLAGVTLLLYFLGNVLWKELKS